MPFLDLKSQQDRERLNAVSEDIHRVVLEVSGEHGDGRLRSEYLEKIYGETLYEAFQEVKRAADPNDVFNPAKVVPDLEGRPVEMDESPRFDGYDPGAVETVLNFVQRVGSTHWLSSVMGVQNAEPPTTV
jgi:hypothetical protein